MIDTLVHRALMRRDLNGVPLRGGAIVSMQYAATHALEDAAMDLTAMIWERIREQIREHAAEHDVDLSTGTMHASLFTPEELRDEWDRLVNPTDKWFYPETVPPPENVHAFVGYWVPETKRGPA
jgi:hypothetical protein